MHKRSILKKTFEFGASTLFSRLLALPREVLQIKFLGVGALSDAFIAAFRLPNLLRRVFAEGALSAAFIPVFVRLTKNKEHKTAQGLMTISFIFFESIVLTLCIAVFLFPGFIVKLVTPGFSAQQISYAIPLIRILFPLLFFISSSALLAGALQSINHFFAPAFGPALHNIIYVSTLILCLAYKLDVTMLALGILLGGVANFLMHLFFYLKYRFYFGPITKEAKAAFASVMYKFLPCLFGVGVVELNLFLDNQISSFLHEGAYSLLYYGNRFMNMPLGIFGVALSTVLLPHFSRIALFAPKRLSFYLVEVAKFVTWVIVPSTLFLFFIAHKIFFHMLSKPENIAEASGILIFYSAGLVFFCFNKILINMFYAMRDTWSPTIASIIATVANLFFNIIGMYFFGSFGIAASTSISGVILTGMCLFYLRKKHKFRFYSGSYLLFWSRYAGQLTAGISLFLASYYAFLQLCSLAGWHSFFYIRWGYWLFTIPLFLSTMVFMFYTKNFFRIKLYFLNK